ncbi:MAG: DUF1015 domain-containing protein [Treponemataceae bacterium]|nr:DUF1015 domain-containing protein [Treponemataceae bacterium]
MTAFETYEAYGVAVPEILLPEHIDLRRWAVIACDQYTQDRSYWQKAAQVAGDEPSTLNLIFPEAYLADADKDERIARIKQTMRRYLDDGVFAPARPGFMYIERTTAYGRTRKGLILAVDLDKYEWQPFSKAMIRATEATVPERIPPRMKIRTGAPLELPHIMLLADDPDDALVGKTGELAKAETPVYDGDLQQESGHLTGWAVCGDAVYAHVARALDAIAQKGTDKDGNTFLFAVGDGNHSLATAKAVWDEHKKTLRAQGRSDAEISASPVRHALVEVVNIYDAGLTFEPIHRVVFNADNADLIAFLRQKLGGTVETIGSAAELERRVSDRSARGAPFGLITTDAGKTTYQLLQTAITDLAIASLQPALDEYIAAHQAAGIEIDYIHGTDETVQLGSTDGQLGILLPPIAKDSFFATINGRGPLPRKSFSMGEASEKRFYVEARRLF